MNNLKTFKSRLFLAFFCLSLLALLTLCCSAAGAVGCLQGGDTEIGATYGDPLTLVFSLEGGNAPTGEVSFTANGNLLGGAEFGADGTATLRLDCLRLVPGTYTLVAAYGGDMQNSAASDACTLTVERREVTVEGLAVVEKTYDGTNGAVLDRSGVVIGNTLPGETLQIDPYNGVACFDDYTVGRGRTVSVSGLSFHRSSPEFVKCYKLPAQVSFTADILPCTLKVSGLLVSGKVYDGTAALVLSTQNATLSGVPECDLGAVALGELIAYAASSAAGEQRVLFGGTGMLTGDRADNYVLELPDTITVTISPAPLRIRVDRVTLYKGQTLPALTVCIDPSGFVAGESAESLSGFSLPVATPATAVDTMTMPTSVGLLYTGGNATGNYYFDCAESLALEVLTIQPSPADYSVGGVDLARWQSKAITVLPTGDFTAILFEGARLPSLLLDTEGEHTVSFMLVRGDGAVSEPLTLDYRLDLTAPTGDVLAGTQSLLAAGTPQNRFFFRDGVLLTLFAADTTSGVARVEYQLLGESEFVEVSIGDGLTLPAGRVSGITLRITDAAGNVALLVSEGIVTFEDVVAPAQGLTFERLSGKDASLALDLKGNRLAAVLYEGRALAAGEYAIAPDGTLTLLAAFLESLPAGKHFFTLSFLPMGVTPGADAVGDLPHDAVLDVAVSLRTPTAADFNLLPPDHAVYNGAEQQATPVAPEGMGDILQITYINAAGERLGAMLHAGSYTVEVVLGNGTHYAAATLSLGEVVIEKMKPASPKVSFDAPTRTLVGETAGLLCSVNGGDFFALPEGLGGIVTDACTLTLYLPGDGLDTLDSEPAVLTLMRAAKPALEVVHESLFLACDGKILPLVAGVEYRPTGGGTWTTASADGILSLAPGSYELRVAAHGEVLESEVVTVVINAAPEFLPLEKEAVGEGLPKLTVAGSMTALAEFALAPLSLDEPTLADWSAGLDRRTTEVLGFFELGINGRYNGELVFVLSLGEQYDGRTVTVHRKGADGAIFTENYLCSGGEIRFTGDCPCAMLLTVPMQTPQGSGTSLWISVLVGIGGTMVLIFVFIELRSRRRPAK